MADIITIAVIMFVLRDISYKLSGKKKPPLFKVNPKTGTFFGQPTRLRPNRKWYQSKYY